MTKCHCLPCSDKLWYVTSDWFCGGRSQLIHNLLVITACIMWAQSGTWLVLIMINLCSVPDLRIFTPYLYWHILLLYIYSLASKSGKVTWQSAPLRTGQKLSRNFTPTRRRSRKVSQPARILYRKTFDWTDNDNIRGIFSFLTSLPPPIFNLSYWSKMPNVSSDSVLAKIAPRCSQRRRYTLHQRYCLCIRLELKNIPDGFSTLHTSCSLHVPFMYNFVYMTVSTLRPGNVWYVLMFGWWMALLYVIVGLLMGITIVGRHYGNGPTILWFN